MVHKKTLTTRNLILCAMFAALIAAGAFLKIPFSPVPTTLQFLFSNLAGLLLGSLLGAAAAGVYIAIGLVGLPVFSNGGGVAYIFQPTFGYILGFCLGAYLAGLIVERSRKPSYKTYLFAGFANMSAVYILGTAYFYITKNVYLATPFGFRELLITCFLTTLPADILKCILCAVLAQRLRPLVTRT